MSVIIIKELTKSYGRRVGVEKLNLVVGPGTLFGFLGPNGAGKTTTMRVLLGFLRPSGGCATIFGLDCWRDSHRIKAKVGYLPGDLRLYPWFTCAEAIRISGRARGLDLTDAGDELARDFELDPAVPVRKMSRGMRQKLGIILALAHRPQLLVLDEPTISLDPLVRETLFQHLRLLAEAGHTIFLSSHTLSEVERLCHRVAILREGKLVAEESLEALRTRAKRIVSIQWKSSVAPERVRPPDCLRVQDRQNHQWNAVLTGPVMDLIRWSATQPIEDISIGKPDLTHLFQQYYAVPEEAR